MNTEIVTEASRKTMAGTLSFPEAVGRLLAVDVEYYHVDHVRRRKAFYSVKGETVVTPMVYIDLPPVAAEFFTEKLPLTFSTASGMGSRITTSPGARWKPVCKAASPFCAANG